MKKFVLSFVMVCSMTTISAAPMQHTTDIQNIPEATAKDKVPNNLIVKQTVTLDDGTTIVVYYVKNGNTWKLYSEQNLNAYSTNDLFRIGKSSFERVTSFKGKCYMTKSTAQVIKLLKGAVSNL